jgi:hypothetical protein
MRAEFKPSFKRDFQALEPPTRQRVSVFCLEIIPAAKIPKRSFRIWRKEINGREGLL